MCCSFCQNINSLMEGKQQTELERRRDRQTDKHAYTWIPPFYCILDAKTCKRKLHYFILNFGMKFVCNVWIDLRYWVMCSTKYWRRDVTWSTFTSRELLSWPRNRADAACVHARHSALRFIIVAWFTRGFLFGQRFVVCVTAFFWVIKSLIDALYFYAVGYV